MERSWQDCEFIIVKLQIFDLFDKIEVGILEFELVKANVKFAKQATHV